MKLKKIYRNWWSSWHFWFYYDFGGGGGSVNENYEKSIDVVEGKFARFEEANVDLSTNNEQNISKGVIMLPEAKGEPIEIPVVLWSIPNQQKTSAANHTELGYVQQVQRSGGHDFDQFK